MENNEIKLRLETLYKKEEGIFNNIKQKVEYYIQNAEKFEGKYDDVTNDILNNELAELFSNTSIIKSCNDTLEKENVVSYKLNEDKTHYTLIFDLKNDCKTSSFTAGTLKRIENELCKKEQLESCLFAGIEFRTVPLAKEDTIFTWIEENLSDRGMVADMTIESAKYYTERLNKIRPFARVFNALSLADFDNKNGMVRLAELHDESDNALHELALLIEDSYDRIELSKSLDAKITEILKPYSA